MSREKKKSYNGFVKLFVCHTQIFVATDTYLIYLLPIAVHCQAQMLMNLAV